LKGSKWFSGQQPFQDWIQKEFIQLRSSWIQEKDLKDLGYGEVIDAYKNLLSVMEKASGNNNLAKLKLEEVKPIKTNPNYKQMHVDRILYGQPQGLNPRIYAPIRDLKERMVIWGMISNKGKPKASGAIFQYHEIFIVDFYKQKALGFLNYYKPAVNFHEVKNLVDYHMRWSLLHTLAGKYKKKVHYIIKRYGKTPKIVLENSGKAKIPSSFLTPNEINHRSRGFNKLYDSVIYKESLDVLISKLSVPKALFAKKCAVKGCTNENIEVHHVRALKRIRHGYFVESIKSKNKRLRDNLTKIESALNRKQIPLCKEHQAQWPKLDKSQMDESYLRNEVEPIISASKEA
jgi:hypothetical protein